MILFYCLIKRAILLDLLRSEVKFRIHEALNEYEIEIHIKICFHNYNEHRKLSFFGLYISCLFESKVNWNRKDKNLTWQGVRIIS